MLIASCDKNKSAPKHSQQTGHLSNKKGQIVVEYVLILLVTVVLGAVIVKMMVDRSGDGDEIGFIIDYWNRLINVIASDV